VLAVSGSQHNTSLRLWHNGHVMLETKRHSLITPPLPVPCLYYSSKRCATALITDTQSNGIRCAEARMACSGIKYPYLAVGK